MSELIAGLPPAPPPAKPRDSAIAVPVRRRGEGVEVLWVKRAAGLGFAAGCHAFPGGRLDAADASVPIAGPADSDGPFQVAAIRELFEETGILVAEGNTPSLPQLEQARQALLQEKEGFAAGLVRLGVVLNGTAFRPAGRWITPVSFPVRFDARLYLVEVPPWAPPPSVDARELASAEWVTPAYALGEWTAGRVLLHSPVLHALEVLSAFKSMEDAAARMSAPVDIVGFVATRLEFQKGIRALPLLSATLPPASHTNAYLLGNGEIMVVDPGSADGRECARLFALIEAMKTQGRRPKAIFLTHHHQDHMAGVDRVRERLKLPVWCHAKTADRLSFTPERLLEEGEVITLAGTPPMHWKVLHTPGHARGHLCLLEENSRALIAGDMVSGMGTILIDPPEGDMAEYIAQLTRLRALGIRAIHPAHGPPVADGDAKLQEYLRHREMRERKLVTALLGGGSALGPLAARLYDELGPQGAPVAERSTLAILLKLVREGRVKREGDHYRLMSDPHPPHAS